jgi:predicted DNA-binding transcriptional regulator AlpA
MKHKKVIETETFSLSAFPFLQKSDLIGRKNPDGSRTRGILPLSESTLIRLVRNGGFPKPINISERRIVWSTVAVQKWLAEHSMPKCANSSEFEEAA